MRALLKNLRSYGDAQQRVDRSADSDLETGSNFSDGIASLRAPETDVNEAAQNQHHHRAAIERQRIIEVDHHRSKVKRPKAIAAGGGPSLDWIFVSIFIILAFTLLTATDIPQFEPYTQVQQRYNYESGELLNSAPVPSAPPAMPVRSVPILERAAEASYHYPGLGRIGKDPGASDPPTSLKYDPSQDRTTPLIPLVKVNAPPAAPPNSQPQAKDADAPAPTQHSADLTASASPSLPEVVKETQDAKVLQSGDKAADVPSESAPKHLGDSGQSQPSAAAEKSASDAAQPQHIENVAAAVPEQPKPDSGQEKQSESTLESAPSAESRSTTNAETSSVSESAAQSSSPENVQSATIEAVEQQKPELSASQAEAPAGSKVVEGDSSASSEKAATPSSSGKKAKGKRKGRKTESAGASAESSLVEAGAQSQGEQASADPPTAAAESAGAQQSPETSKKAGKGKGKGKGNGKGGKGKSKAKAKSEDKSSASESPATTVAEEAKSGTADGDAQSSKPAAEASDGTTAVDPFQVTGAVSATPRFQLEPSEESLLQFVKQIVRKQKVRIITDLMCVQNAPWLAQFLRVKKLKKLICVDYHQENLDAIKEAYPEFQADNVQFLRGEPAKVWIPKSDLILIMDSMQNKSKGEDSVSFFKKIKDKERASLALLYSSPDALSNRFVAQGAPGDLNFFKPPFNIKRSAALTVSAEAAPPSEPKKLALLYRVEDLVPSLAP